MLKVARIFRWGLALGTAGLVVCSFDRTSNALDNVPPNPPNGPSTAREPSKTNFTPFVLAGGAVRIDDAPLFNITRRVGGNFGIGFTYQIQPISIGLSYEYTDLGREDSGVGPFGFVQIDRSIDTLWASVKVRFSGPTWGTPFFGVAVGGTWQDATMKGVVLLDRGASGSLPFSCTGSDSINLAFRAGGGVDFPLSPNVSLITDASFDVYRLSSDIIEFCAPGAGSTASFLFRVGLAYRFDLAESQPTPRTPTARR
jgi:opacity protein-like surface antigen